MSRRPRLSANVRRETRWVRLKLKFRKSSLKRLALHLRAMNLLYEAMKEKGSMIIVPSSAVETMGLGGTLATAAIARSPKPGSAGA
jgi:hypothetical protein